MILLPAPSRRQARRLAAALAAVVALLAAPAPAYAHGHLTASQPAAGARLTVAPSMLALTFSEAPELAVTSLRLLLAGADSTQVVLGTLQRGGDAHTVTAAITGPLRAGRYVVYWQMAGADGHVTRGNYSFTIAEGAAGLQPLAAKESAIVAPTRPDTALLARPGGFDSSSSAYVGIRWAQFAGLLLLIGAVAFRWWVLPRAGASLVEPVRQGLTSRLAAVGLWGGWLLAVTALLRLIAQSATIHGPAGMLDPALVGTLVGATSWGHGWVFEVVWLAVALPSLAQARRNPASPVAWGFAAAATVALAFVPALSGHAAAMPAQAAIAVVADVFHVLGAGAWLGGLAMVLFVALPMVAREAGEPRVDALAPMVNAFSRLALGSAALLVLTGVIAARYHVGSFHAFRDTSYGQVLLVKLALVLFLVLVGSYNWRRVKPSLATDPAGPARLRRSARLELALGLAVLLVTAFLVALPTPMDL